MNAGISPIASADRAGHRHRSHPIGWVSFAAIASGGACYGLYRLLGQGKDSRVIERDVVTGSLESMAREAADNAWSKPFRQTCSFMCKHEQS